VVRVPGYRSRGLGFDSWCYQIFCEAVGLERGSLSLVSTIEELLGRKSKGSGLGTEIMVIGIVALTAKVGTNFSDKWRSLATKAMEFYEKLDFLLSSGMIMGIDLFSLAPDSTSETGVQALIKC
jgi:hypothetical protein